MSIKKLPKIVGKRYELQTNIYYVRFKITDESEIYLEDVIIHPKYRRKGYLRKIMDNLCTEYKCSLFFESARDEIIPMYEHIGAFVYEPDENGDVCRCKTMIYDPLGINY